MKNIHILQTDKPSKLAYYQESTSYDESVLQLVNHTSSDYKYQNIYITSDEMISRSEWCIDKGGIVHKFVKFMNYNHYKKIILTTDPVLIKDCIQSIDDDFLEWLVKNSSWTKVEVKPYCEKLTCQNKECNVCCQELKYKIIIPKEKPLRDVNWESDIINKVWDEETEPVFITPEEVRKTQRSYKESKQENFEEVVEKYSKNKLSKLGFINGYKLAQEILYTEEEVEDLVYNVCGTVGRLQGLILDGSIVDEAYKKYKKR